MTEPTRSPWAGRIAAGIVVALAGVACFAPWLAPHDPAVSVNLDEGKLLAPSASHWMGTDAAARDVLSRMIHGTRVSLGTALLAVMIVLAVGVGWGTVAGLANNRVDRAMMWIVDGILATPRILVVLALVAFLGRLSPAGLAAVLGFTSWPQVSRMVRMRVRELSVADYVVAARALGTPMTAVVWRHVLPATWPVVVAGIVVTVTSVIPLEAALTYFGAGIAPPAASWGTILQDATARPLQTWWLLVFPSAAIAATVMSVQILGDRFRRADGNRLPT